jgi:hypothetical protein
MINDEFGKKIHATNKFLGNISAKMDSFMVATQNQLSFNKMLERDSADRYSTSTSKQWGSNLEPRSREREVHLHCVQGKGPKIY